MHCKGGGSSEKCVTGRGMASTIHNRQPYFFGQIIRKGHIDCMAVQGELCHEKGQSEGISPSAWGGGVKEKLGLPAVGDPSKLFRDCERWKDFMAAYVRIVYGIGYGLETW